MSFGNMEAFADAFADRDDILLELPWGKYLSRDSIRTCLLSDAAQDRHWHSGYPLRRDRVPGGCRRCKNGPWLLDVPEHHHSKERRSPLDLV